MTESRRRRQFLRGQLTRCTGDRIVAGVAAGAASRLGIGSAYARAAFVTLSFAGGVGMVLYLVGWLGAPEEGEADSASPLGQTLRITGKLGLGAVFFAVLLLLEGTGLWFGFVTWPAALVAFGLALVWDRTGIDFASHVTNLTRPQDGGIERRKPFQLLVGVSLLVGGAVVMLNSAQSFSSLGPVVAAVVLTAAGFMLVFGPWTWRLVEDLIAERRARIRSEERSEMAAHLHDSVLQTLALIQRSDDPKRTVTLARAQERELREWLFGGDEIVEGETLRSAIESAASRVEAAHDVPVEVVVVGDRASDDWTRGIIAALTEAMSNAARHSGADRISVYAEADGEKIDAWVSDQGCGFDPSRVQPDRHGISNSIRARIERLGGTVEIASESGAGTEVHLELETP